jgi:hypothetical protein
MTNEQWSDVTRYLKLPDAARKPLEEQIASYRSRDIFSEFGSGAEPDPRPSDVKKKLERAASLAGELLDILEGVKTLGYDVLISPAVSEACFDVAKRREALWGNSSTLIFYPPLECPEGESADRSASIAMIHHHAHLTALYDRFSIAAETFAIKGKPGSDPSDVRALLKRVSEIVETHTGKALSKGKPETDFARKFCELADPQIGPGAIKLALENLRARIAAKKSSNPG